MTSEKCTLPIKNKDEKRIEHYIYHLFKYDPKELDITGLIHLIISNFRNSDPVKKEYIPGDFLFFTNKDDALDFVYYDTRKHILLTSSEKLVDIIKSAAPKSIHRIYLKEFLLSRFSDSIKECIEKYCLLSVIWRTLKSNKFFAIEWDEELPKSIIDFSYSLPPGMIVALAFKYEDVVFGVDFKGMISVESDMFIPKDSVCTVVKVYLELLNACSITDDWKSLITDESSRITFEYILRKFKD